MTDKRISLDVPLVSSALQIGSLPGPAHDGSGSGTPVGDSIDGRREWLATLCDNYTCHLDSDNHIRPLDIRAHLGTTGRFALSTDYEGQRLDVHPAWDTVVSRSDTALTVAGGVVVIPYAGLWTVTLAAGFAITDNDGHGAGVSITCDWVELGPGRAYGEGGGAGPFTLAPLTALASVPAGATIGLYAFSFDPYSLDELFETFTPKVKLLAADTWIEVTMVGPAINAYPQLHWSRPAWAPAADDTPGVAGSGGSGGAAGTGVGHGGASPGATDPGSGYPDPVMETRPTPGVGVPGPFCPGR